LRSAWAIAAAGARSTLHLFREEKAKCPFVLFLPSWEVIGLVGSWKSLISLSPEVSRRFRVDDQGRQHVLLSSNTKILCLEAEVAPATVHRVPGWKDSLDFTCILLSLPVWLPLMLLLILLTRIASPGPVFFRQKRVGLGGRQFLIWKFRTMRLSAETQTHERYFEELMRSDCPMTKLDTVGDSRLAPFGRILRASGLDELPQIFNVLCGEMSLVGPRPCLPNEFAKYEPWQRERVNALPGLTGYWQVNGKNKTTFSEMIAMDLFYFHNMSLLLDLKIMLKTVGAIAGQCFESHQAAQRRLQEEKPRSAAPILQTLAEPAPKSPRPATTILSLAESASKI
jgi:exopolysaccharide production protein ExoY